MLANSGYGTRSQVRDLIRSGRVFFHGEPVYDSALSINDDQSSFVVLDGSPIVSSRFLYIALNKPAGYLTALLDSRLPTIAEFITKEQLFKGLSPVGRLDFNTTGLLLLTNNGTLSHRLTSPKWHIDKTYRVTYTGEPLTEDICSLFESGMTLLEPNHEPVKLAGAKLILSSPDTCLLTLTEGKSHQVKRMIASVGRSVTALDRVSVGGITYKDGPEIGQTRSLTDDEIDLLFTKCGLEGTPK